MKKVIINYFKIVSRYHVNEGYIHLKWNVENAFVLIIFSRKFFKLVESHSEIKILKNKSKNYRLLAIGLFSFAVNTINVKSINASIIKKKINPKPVEVELKNKMELVRFTKSNIKLKIINP